MAARAIWRGVLQLGAEKVPVKLYSAVEERPVRFRMIHRTDGVPLRQRMVDSRTGEEVTSDKIVRGVEVSEGTFVTFDDAELSKSDPPESRDIELLRFVPAEAIDVGWYDRPYYLGPDEDDDAYGALVEVLRKTGRRGIARWTMRKKRYRGALEARGHGLVLVTLHSSEEVIPASQMPALEGAAGSPAERKLAEQLVETLDAPFEPESFRDEYRERVLALIEAKAKGHKLPAAKEEPRPRAAPSIADALRESLRRAKEKKVA